MGKKSTLVIILFIVLLLYIVLERLGLTLIGQIIGVASTIAALILNFSNIKAMNKKLLATVMTITIIPALVILYAIFFHGNSLYWLYGSFICFLLSFPISIAVISAYRKNYSKLCRGKP